MPVKIRLSRFGRRKRPFYRIIAADSRSPRDGKFLEILGYYDPLKEPAEVKIDHEKALKWLKVGAQPTDTARSLLSREGIMLKFHLMRKNFPEERIEEIYNEWKKQKEDKLEKIREEARKKKEALLQKQLEAEKIAREKRRQKIAAKKQEKAAAQESENTEE